MKKIIVCLLAIFVLSTSAYGQVKLDKNPHDFAKMGKNCFDCHISIPKTGFMKAAFRKSINYLCYECHPPEEKLISHAVGVEASMPVPKDLHLTVDGKISCATCHNIHGEWKDPATKKQTYFLRRPTRGRQLCRACHPELKFRLPKISTIEVLIPVNNIILTQKSITIAGTVNDPDLHEIKLIVNEDYLNPIIVQNRFFSKDIELAIGDNFINLGNVGDNITLNLKYKEFPDKKDTVYSYHPFTTSEECNQCHNKVSMDYYRIKKWDSDLCYKCHDRQDSFAYTHFPIKNGNCLICHAPHGSTNQFHLTKDKRVVCFICHDGVKVTEHYLSYSEKECLTCHNPHGSSQKYQLIKNMSEYSGE